MTTSETNPNDWSPAREENKSSPITILPESINNIELDDLLQVTITLDGSKLNTATVWALIRLQDSLQNKS